MTEQKKNYYQIKVADSTRKCMHMYDVGLNQTETQERWSK